MYMLARDEGFEPPIMGPEPIALPLGQSLITDVIIAHNMQTLKRSQLCSVNSHKAAI